MYKPPRQQPVTSCLSAKYCPEQTVNTSGQYQHMLACFTDLSASQKRTQKLKIEYRDVLVGNICVRGLLITWNVDVLQCGPRVVSTPQSNPRTCDESRLAVAAPISPYTIIQTRNVPRQHTHNLNKRIWGTSLALRNKCISYII